MRLVIRLSAEEQRQRIASLLRDETPELDDLLNAGPLSEVHDTLHRLVDAGIQVEAVDLEGPDGSYLYTLTGEER